MRHTPKLGQHFLIHNWAARALAHAVSVRSDETIVEIGPGKGILTKELLTLGRVVAIEKDAQLVAHLRTVFQKEIGKGDLTIIEADVRDIVVESEPVKTVSDARRGEDGDRPVPERTERATLRLRNDADGIVLAGDYVVAANIPYYITGEIIRQFLTAQTQPRALALLVQKEVAQRVVSKKESILSLSVKAYGTARITDKVPRKHFSPPPSVDSAILLIDNVSKDFFAALEEEAFFKVVHAGFASKRKFVSNNLAVAFGKEKAVHALAEANVPDKARAEDVPLEKWKTLAEILTG